MISTHAFALGHESSGGGNSTTDRYQDIENIFGKDQAQMKAYLKTFLQEIVNYSSQGENSALLQDLISKGLIEDIDLSPYVFSKKCVEDETGDEKDASTLRGVRNASVCINLPKLAQGNASESEIVGLMMHEHMRHFGLEDTTELGMHPVAVYTTSHFDCRQAKSQRLLLSKRFGLFWKKKEFRH